MNSISFYAFRWTLLIIETLLASFLFFYKLERRKHFILKLISGFIILAGIIAGLTYFENYFFEAVNYNNVAIIFTSCFCYILLFGVIFLWMLILFKGGPYELFSNYLKAYSLRQFSFSIYILIVEGFNPSLNFLDISHITVASGFLYVGTYLFVYLIFGILLLKNIIDSSLNKLDKPLFFFYSIIILFNIILSSICEYFSRDNSLMYIMAMISELLSLTLIISFDNFVKRNNDLKIDNYIASRLLKQQEWQYKYAKTNMEALKIKAHDLKHQVRILRQGGKEAEELLNQLDDDISAYNEIIVTDNQVLNIILQEKWYYCKKHDIKLTMNVNPNAFKEVSNTDLYTLVGNILDNAIEAVMQIQNKEKRIISVDVSDKQHLSKIVCYNYFSGDIQYDQNNKSFKTHKSDKVNHGLGIKSIELLAHKYDGISEITIDDDVFTITVSIPDKES